MLAVEPGHAERDLVERGVVCDRVGVEEVGTEIRSGRTAEHVAERTEALQRVVGEARRWRACVDVHELGMSGDAAVVGSRGVAVLEEMVPDVPLPDDLPAARRAWRDLEDHVGPQPLVGDPILLFF